eukprot:CAMPEP_0197417314 /NCGR_PEP_ID=MMETSP1170-20131217/3393_1 /TAXON_ID=54406 /ORGANISM="Sarcinochrysis sp, Strain CCMP770" /LENGTH=47 /DNA_ID= /DNA_START= /DNA_END= /DNA_ORIENTATION=
MPASEERVKLKMHPHQHASNDHASSIPHSLQEDVSDRTLLEAADCSA